jgi:DNA-binding transcriptional ArsR family regulator
MPEALCDSIFRLLENDRQLSISHITRELKAMDTDEHRLIITGYLRALRDMGKLDELEVPPSKTYKLKEQSGESAKDFYSLLGKALQDVRTPERFYVAVHIVSSLLERPVFKEELKLLGITEKLIEKSMSEEGGTVRQHPGDLKEVRRSITGISIPESDPAYELTEQTPQILALSFPVILEVSRGAVDLHGLIPKTKQVSFENYS